MAVTMEKVLLADQYGFYRNCSVQSATMPILEAIINAEVCARPLQLFSIDLNQHLKPFPPCYIRSYEARKLLVRFTLKHYIS
jgi:hypothetical protein